MDCSIQGWKRCVGLGAALLIATTVDGANLTPEAQGTVRAATFEVVLPKADVDPLTYEKPLPLDLIPYVIRSDKYWSIGTAFAIGPNTYVTAAHVLQSVADRDLQSALALDARIAERFGSYGVESP